MQKLKANLKLNVLWVFGLVGLIFVFSAGTTLGHTITKKNLPNSLSGENHLWSTSALNKSFYQISGGHHIFSGRLAALPESYPLVIRGGQGLQITYLKTQTESLIKLIIRFSFSSQPAGNGLRNGEGSWVDRGGREGEPARLEYYIDMDYAKKINNYLKGPNAYYTFECYNTGKGYMQVTKAYPKSVRID